MNGPTLMTDYERFLSPTGRQLTESAIRSGRLATGQRPVPFGWRLPSDALRRKRIDPTQRLAAV